MITRTSNTLIAAAILSAGLLAMPFEAGASPQNIAQYQILLSTVQAPNTQPALIPSPIFTERSAPYAWENPNTPVPVVLSGQADTGTNQNGYGWSSGHALARAEAGVLAAAAHAEAQAVARPDTNSGGGVTVTTLAGFTDSVTFTPVGPTYQNLLVVSGTLLLTGDMYLYGNGYGYVSVGGTGLNPLSSSASWTGESNGTQRSALGVYSSWVPGSQVSIPFSMTLYGGQATELDYWLKVYASAGATFPPCVDSLGGGLCDVNQSINSSLNVDYSHTLAWGGVKVTDWNGTPVNFSVASASGFNYAAAVPEPETYAMMIVGLGFIGGIARRRRQNLAAA